MRQAWCSPTVQFGMPLDCAVPLMNWCTPEAFDKDLCSTRMTGDFDQVLLTILWFSGIWGRCPKKNNRNSNFQYSLFSAITYRKQSVLSKQSKAKYQLRASLMHCKFEEIDEVADGSSIVSAIYHFRWCVADVCQSDIDLGCVGVHHLSLSRPPLMRQIWEPTITYHRQKHYQQV